MLQHPQLNPLKMAMICDVFNPGFKMQRELDGDNPEMLAAQIRANTEDFSRLHPGSWEAKWEVDRESLCRKLWEMTPRELAQGADQFWEATVHKRPHQTETFDIPRGRKINPRQ